MSNTTDKFTGVLKGWDDLIKDAYGLKNSVASLTASRDALEANPDLALLFKALIERIKCNFRPGSNSDITGSIWRLRKARKISETNPSREKQLEKRAAKEEGWFNQMPAASGYSGSKGNRKNSIDLVYEVESEEEYAFIELKVLSGSGNPFYATYEILSYGFLYLFTRTNAKLVRLLGQNQDRRVMKASEIHLVVLAPKEYYKEFENHNGLKLFESFINNALSKFASQRVEGLKMNFEFRQFSNSTSLEDIKKFNGFKPNPDKGRPYGKRVFQAPTG